MLSIKHLTKSALSKKIINDLNLTVKRGEIAVLLGQSGVGKSTLLRILNNLETYDTGIIEIDNKPIDLKTVNSTHTIGMVFQHFNLFEHLTVKQNIVLALTHVTHKNTHEITTIADQLLKYYSLEDKAHAMPSQLSGGQKQRVALARTLALKPLIVCLDEPTSALDPLLTAHVANTIQDLAAQGYTVLVATHDITLLEKLSCTIHLIRDGTIVETVNSKTFFADKNSYSIIASFIEGNN